MKRSICLRLATLAGAAAGLALSATASAQFGVVNNRPGSFTDISATGASITFGDDSSVAFTSSVTNALVTSANLFACTNGDITDVYFYPYFNTPLPAAGVTFGLFPLWDDLYVDTNQAGSLVHQGVVEGGINVEIIQWNNVRTYAGGPGSATGTFEIKIFASGPVFAQFIYQDPSFEGGGASATIGAQWGAGAYEQYSYNTATVQAGTVLSIVTVASGACCLSDGSCQVYSSSNCVNSGGTYRGDNTSCATANCPSGACCLPDLTCATSTGPACSTQGGTYHGDGSTCATANCPTPGACCLADGTCTQTTSTGCSAAGGVYHGDSTPCASVSCPTGACCLPNLTCAARTDAGCTLQNGTYHGDGSSCGSVTCPFGACCATDGTCTIQIPSGCSGAGGVYRGDGTVCATANCPLPPGVWVELGDAGDFMETANISAGDGPLNTIRGELGASDADMYAIRICDIGNFSAVTCGLTGVDTQLFLFDASGVGVVADDDWCGVQSTIDGSSGCLSSASNGVYFLAISSYNNDPTSGGTPIFTSNPFNVIYCPNIFTPMDGWSGGGGTGTYSIALTGSCFALPAASSCYANCDHSTTQPCLNVLDFTCFLNAFAASSTYANCDQSTNPPVLNVLDFTCFLNKFAAGCSGC